MTASNLTANRLREVLHYDPDTGVFIRLSARDAAYIGREAGNFRTNSGYRYIWIGRERHPAHRLAWLYVHGKWPSSEVDHLDGNRANNAIANLRDAGRRINQQNRRSAQTNNATGVLGVRASKSARNPWQAQLTVNGASMYLGAFKTIEQAHAAYVRAKRIHHAGCTL